MTAREWAPTSTPMNNTPPITRASVKVMRSYDYCHFEVVLGTDDPSIGDSLTAEQVDEMRKTAARLADKAVEQYKIARAAAELRANSRDTLKQDYRREWYETALAVPENERTPAQKAEVKGWKDAQFHANRSCYDYQDDWRDDEDESE